MYTNRAICTRISEKRHIVDYVDKRLPRICVSGTRLIQISSTRDSYTIITHKLRYSFQIISSSFLHFISIPIPYRSIAFLIRSIAHTHTYGWINIQMEGQIFFVSPCASIHLRPSIDRSITPLATGPLESFQESRRYRKWIKLEIYSEPGLYKTHPIGGNNSVSPRAATR